MSHFGQFVNISSKHCVNYISNSCLCLAESDQCALNVRCEFRGKKPLFARHYYFKNALWQLNQICLPIVHRSRSFFWLFSPFSALEHSLARKCQDSLNWTDRSQADVSVTVVAKGVSALYSNAN